MPPGHELWVVQRQPQLSLTTGSVCQPAGWVVKKLGHAQSVCPRVPQHP